MNTIARITITLLFTIECVLIVLIIPLIFSINRDSTKEALSRTNLSGQLLTIGRQAVAEYAKTPTLFNITFSHHFDSLITTEWLTESGNNLVDAVYNSLEYGQPFSYTLSISAIKQKLIPILTTTSGEEKMQEVSDAIPDTVKLESLLEIPPQAINQLLNTARGYFYALRLTSVALGLLAIITFSAMVLTFTRAQLVTSVLTASLLSGFILIVSSFSTKLVLLSSSGLDILMSKAVTIVTAIALVIGLSILEKLVTVWSVAGIILFTIGLSLVITRLVLKKS